MTALSILDVCGLIGAAMFLVAFAGVQFEKLHPLRLPALLLNFFGAVLVVASLSEDFNLAAFILETVWGLIALFGLARYAMRRGRD